VPRYKLTIAYDGTEFCGWQRQEPFAPDDQDERPRDQRPAVASPTAMDAATALPPREGETRARVALRTVQHVVEQAVMSVVRQQVSLVGASRTDSGVHARGQVAAFTCSPRTDEIDPPSHAGWPVERGTDRLMRAINGRLPDDVQVLSVEEAPDGFNPIRGAVDKAYSYTIHEVRPPPRGQGLQALWGRRYVHQVWDEINVAAMQEAAAHIVGEHDFVSFAAANHGRLTTVRTVFGCTVTSLGEVENGHRLRIDVSGSGFLYNMVRIISGTLLEVGRGRKSAGDIPGIIEAKDRRAAGPTLPPTGLCLEWIRYSAAD
jgi:tRNA pseudouridine38-40 synthase